MLATCGRAQTGMIRGQQDIIRLTGTRSHSAPRIGRDDGARSGRGGRPVGYGRPGRNGGRSPRVCWSRRSGCSVWWLMQARLCLDMPIPAAGHCAGRWTMRRDSASLYSQCETVEVLLGCESLAQTEDAWSCRCCGGVWISRQQGQAANLTS